METRTGPFRRLARFTPALGLLLFLAACAHNYPQTTLKPRGDFARLVDGLFRTTVWWAIVVFVLVEGALLIAIFKFRGRPDDPEPKQVHGNTVLEVVWTIIPAFILVMIAVPTIKTIFRTSDYAAGDVVQIEVIGHQWWWEFRYTGLGVVTANELHVPVGKTVNLRMTTVDVLHSFWVPQFAAKRDVFPRRHNPLWFKAEVTGSFSGQCAEFCGAQHGRMGFRVISESPEEFAVWVERQRVGSPLVNQGKVAADSVPPIDSIEVAGRALFSGGGCIGCHALVGTPLAGQTSLKGPNLSHVGSRTTIVAGMLQNTPENLRKWLSNPDSVKKGTLMVLPRKLTDAELTLLVAYLRSHQ
ncbi:MAG TPA: cytochrome c oxidase subunit II [Gemmatimonadales bacterium]|jgi:cytochrome c oxidase subunit 2|nr:cytochrome c oxidase subunit II [Gemmatimonadales bacterium]HEV8599848.1 cytochrome c oxidase subunit II [Gemmatimonadales bacterium]